MKISSKTIASELLPLMPMESSKYSRLITSYEHIGNNDARIIVISGISGSGKSSYSRELINRIDNSVIISRDSIRKLLYGLNDTNIDLFYNENKGDESVYSRMKEVNTYRDTLINDSLRRGKTIILDDTNLEYNDFENLKYWNVDVKIILIHRHIDSCIKDDNKRLSPVGIDKVKRQFDKFKHVVSKLKKEPIDFTPKVLTYDYSKSDIYIFDIDGTIAEKGRRNPYDMDSVDEDTYIKSVMDVMKSMMKNNNVLVCTGRNNKSKVKTLEWFSSYGVDIPNDKIFFRGDKDQRADWKVKSEMWDEISKRYNIVGMFDDRLQVVRHARNLGYKVFNVEYNNF